MKKLIKILIAFFLLWNCNDTPKEIQKEEIIHIEEPQLLEQTSVVPEAESAFATTKNPADFKTSNMDINFFKNSVFYVGPSVEVNDCEIIAECDCCDAELITFDNDFYYISYCLGGDSYSKGNFEIDDGRLLLIFEDKYIAYDLPGESGNSEISEPKISVRTSTNREIGEIQILKCADRRILSFQFDKYVEFGALTNKNNIDYIDNFKKQNNELWLKFVNL